jgi:hypothetical protein
MTKLLCPICGYPQHCDCNEFCKSRIPDGEKAKIWNPDGDSWKCANCGFVAHVDEWLDIEMKQSGFIEKTIREKICEELKGKKLKTKSYDELKELRKNHEDNL